MAMDDFQAIFLGTCLDLVALVFLLSGAAKIINYRAFREGLIYIPYMPVSLSYLVAWTLPALEVVVAAGLFMNLLAAKVAALTLLILFCGVVALVLGKRLKVPCGCFEGLGKRYLSASTLRDNGLLAIALLATFLLPVRGDVEQSLPVGAFVLLFYLALHELLGQRRFLAGLREREMLP
jgi:hypothetical protein